MIIQRIRTERKVDKKYYPIVSMYDDIFSAKQGKFISTGKTASEAINNLLANIYRI